jgi:putative spermidine/putrescine transport system substrate-binding protein
MKRRRLFVALVGAVALIAAGCGDDSGDDAADETTETTAAEAAGPEALKELGPGEGSVDIIAWAGYVEDGTNDAKNDWVTAFEKDTGCNVNVTLGNTSDEMVNLMKQGNHDGVSASGDATLRLIAAGDVAPVNTALIPNYADVFAGLKDKPHNTVDGKNYGVPHGRGANLLMYNTKEVTPAPDSWGVVWDPASKYKGKITAYDSPIYIADAALYLKATKPELKIDNVYELDQTQFDAAIELLKTQRTIIGEYWSDYTKEIDAFAKGNSVAGTTWQVIANVLKADNAPIEVTLPKEGSTGWSDTWMISAKAKHPNCMYMFMNHIISPEVNAKATEYFGEAPSNTKSCALTTDKEHCTKFHAEDEEYFKKVAFWTTPEKDCGDDRGAVCKDYSEWVSAWTTVKG